MRSVKLIGIGRHLTNWSHVKNVRNCVRHSRWMSSEATATSATRSQNRKTITTKDGPGLRDFLVAGKNIPAHTATEAIPYLNSLDYNGHGRKVYFEVYGCQMNVNDTEIVWAILKENGYVKTNTIADANVVLVVTCAIREGAEDRVSRENKMLFSSVGIRVCSHF